MFYPRIRKVQIMSHWSEAWLDKLTLKKVNICKLLNRHDLLCKDRETDDDVCIPVHRLYHPVATVEIKLRIHGIDVYRPDDYFISVESKWNDTMRISWHAEDAPPTKSHRIMSGEMDRTLCNCYTSGKIFLNPFGDEPKENWCRNCERIWESL